MYVGGSAVPQALIEAFETRYGLDDHPGLGHDRDGAARHGRPRCPPSMRRRAADGETFALPRQAGTAGAVRRDPRAQRERPRALGRPDDGRARGARAVDRERATTTARTPPIASPDDGWFRTGDIVTIDRDATIQMQDRTEGSDQVGRRVDQLGRARVRADGASRGRRGRRHPGAPARSGASGRSRPSSSSRARAPRRRSSETFLAPQFPKFWLPDAFEFIDAHPADVGRQVQEERAARAVQGLPGSQSSAGSSGRSPQPLIRARRRR